MKQLIDQHGRTINYLRLAVTDRCNLRCFYCMPEAGMDYVPRADLLTYEEMIRLIKLLSTHGVTKVRITGGEPFLRKDLLPFLEAIATLPDISIHITTNGTLALKHVTRLRQLGISSINLSLDSIDRQRFFEITRRDELPKVMETMEAFLNSGIRVKINTVVMAGKNIRDMAPLAMLTQDRPVELRFIEEMPFNGSGHDFSALEWNHLKIERHLKTHFPGLTALPIIKGATTRQFQIPGFKGKIGIIAAYSRTFCGSCNRIRITPEGTLRTCLYDRGVFNIKNMMRSGANDQQVISALKDALAHRAKDGFEAEKHRSEFFPATESMSRIGG